MGGNSMIEGHYLRILEDQTDLICRYEPGGMLSHVNRAYCRFFGKSEEELIGNSFIIDEDERAAVDKYLAGRPDLYDSSLTMEYETISAHGEVRWFQWTMRPIPNEGNQVAEYLAIGRDITERRLAEAELNDYLERMAMLRRVDRELTRRLDIQHVLNMALDLCLRISGASAGFVGLSEDTGNLKLALYIGGYDSEGPFPYLQGIVGRVIEDYQAERVLDILEAPHDNTSVIAHTKSQMAFPLVSQGELVGVICLETPYPQLFTSEIFDFLILITGRVAVALDNARLYDVSQRQLEELQELFEQVSQLEQLKTDMIRIAAHDLRNPITVVQGYLMLLQRSLTDRLTEKERESLVRIQNAANRMHRITNDILSLQRIEEAAKREFTHRIDLVELLRGVFDEYREQAEEKRIRFVPEMTETSVVVLGDETELHEAAANLVNNAIKYTPEGGDIMVRLHRHNGEAVFEVQDTGYGIPDDQQQQLFQPFYRVKTVETESIEGTGLGLHLVKSIIERHKGQMRFRSVFGQGSTFGFQLPLCG